MAARTRSALLRRIRRALSWHRRLVAGVLAAAGVVVGLQALAPAAPASTDVLVAAADLPAGRRLRPGDLTVHGLPPGAVPAGALRPGTEVTGRTLAAPVRAGEPVTDVRLVGASSLRAYGRGLVAAPVRLADAGVLELVRPGDHVDIVAASVAEALDPGRHEAARVVARGARVVALPSTERTSGASLIATPETGGLLLVAVPPAVAVDLAGAAATSRLSLVLRGDA